MRKDMETNAIYCGNCKDILIHHFPEKGIDLIYVDPPFFSNKKYEVIWGNGYELRAFEDRWKGGINNYIAWMEPKIRECHRVLKKTGAMYLHCDWHSSHYLKIKMDEIFGINNFRNEIAVRRIRKNVKERDKVKKLNVGYETILFYAKTNSHFVKPPTKPFHLDERWHALDAPEIRPHLEYNLFGKKPPKGRHWMWTKEKSEEAIEKGILRKNPKTGRPEYLIPKTERILLDSLWDDITSLSFKFGYPTEKSEELLYRIIEMSSNEGDIVLDPMCGCGTAIASSHRLKRRWIGIDISPTACKLMVKRMRKLGAKISENAIVGMPKTLSQIKEMEPFEFQNWVCQKLIARVSRVKSGDMGVDGWLIDGRPLQIKQSERIGRNVVDNFETAIKRKNRDKGIIVAFSFGKGACEEVARAKLEESLEIELKTVEQLLNEK